MGDLVWYLVVWNDEKLCLLIKICVVLFMVVMLSVWLGGSIM